MSSKHLALIVDSCVKDEDTIFEVVEAKIKYCFCIVGMLNEIFCAISYNTCICVFIATNAFGEIELKFLSNFNCKNASFESAGVERNQDSSFSRLSNSRNRA